MSNKVRVNVEFTTDKSKNPLTTSEFIKHGNQWLSEAMNAATTIANSKADKTYVDSELAKKADVSAVTQLREAVSTKADSTTVSSVSDRVSEIETEQTTLSERMDTFTHLEEGSTTGDAELADGRVGADGKTYSNIGGAIRGQVADLKSDLNCVDKAINLALDVEYTENKYIQKSNGNPLTLNGYSCSGFITINPTMKKLIVNAPCGNDSSGLCFYTGGQTYIYGINTHNSPMEIGIPENAKYIRFTVDSSKKSEAFVSYVNAVSNIAGELGVIDKVISTLSNFSFTDGKYVLNSNGNLVNLNGYSCSGFITINPTMKKLIVNAPCGNDSSGLCFYTGGQTYIYGINTHNSPMEIGIPENAKYIRFTVDSSKKSEVVINYSNVLEKVISDIGNDYADISMFKRIGVCGDSYTAGCIYQNGTWKEDRVESSWGKVLGRIAGINVEVYAKGGATTSNYQTWTECLPKLLSEEPCDLYIISLGINDRDNVSLGTIDDIKSDYTQNPNTYYGNYGKIISQIKSHAPNAKIIISKVYLPTNNVYYSWSADAVENIAFKMGIPCLRTERSDYIQSDFYTANMDGSHPTTVTHSGLARAILKLVNCSIRDNVPYFSYIN